MAVDGNLIINTKIDTSGVEKGTDKITSEVKETASDVSKVASQTSEKIQAILNNTEKSHKSKAASIAAVYRSQGMSMSEAMEQAWSHIERNSAEACDGVNRSSKKANKKIRADFSLTKNQVSSGLSSIKSIFGKLALVAGTAFSVRGIANFAKESIELASNLEEVQNVVDVAFGDMSDKMEEFADKAIEMYGISELAAKKTGSTFMAMAKGMQISPDVASDMSIALTALSADMASFHNEEQSVMQTALASVFTGETETLKKYGIVMTETNLQQFAYTQGINKKISAMTQAEKVMLRYNYVMSQTALAQGDFARTSGSWANQTRILSMQWQQFSANLGIIFKNVIKPALTYINQAMSVLIAASERLINTFSELFGWETETSDATGQVSSSIADAVGNQEDLTQAVEDTAKANERALMGFDKINKMSDSSSDSTSSSSAVSVVSGGDLSATMTMDADTTPAEQKLSDFVTKMKEAWSTGDFAGLGGLFAEKVNTSLSTFANDVDWESHKATLKTKINNLFSGINTFVDEVDWSSLSQGISNALSFGISTIDITFEAVNFKNIGEAIAEYISGIDTEKIFGDLGSLLSTGISSAFDLVTGFLQEYDFSELPSKIFSTITSFFSEIDWSEIASSATELIGSALGAIASFDQAVRDFWTNLWTDIKTGFTTYFEEKIEEAGGDIVGGIFKGIVDALSDIGTWIKENIFDPFINGFKEAFGINSPAKEMKPMGEYIIEGLKEGIGDIWSKLSQNFTDLLTNIKTWFAEKKAELQTSWNNFTSVVKDKTANMKAKIATKVSDFKAAWKQRSDVVKDKTAKAKISFSQKVSDIKEKAQKRYDAITGVFGKISDWFKETFSDAWTNVKDVFSKDGDTFKGIKDGILSSLKSIINGLIDGINAVIKAPFDGINTALKKVKDIKIAGATPFKDKIKLIDIPQIPKLATGTVVPANYGEFLAVLGDNKRETEVVSPLSTIKRAVAEVIGDGNNSPIELIVYLDGDVVYRKVVQKNKQETKTRGVNPLAV